MISAESLQSFYRAPGTPPPEQPAGPGVRFVVLTCMDPRLHPEQSLGLSVGDAYVLRNAGGRVSDDTVRSLMIALSQQGAREVVVIHHTDCALSRQTNQTLQAAVKSNVGVDVSTVDFLTFSDLAGSVRDDVTRIARAPQTPGDIAVVGFVCDTNSGILELVVGSPLSQLPAAQTAPPPPPPSTAPAPAPVPPVPPAPGPAWAAAEAAAPAAAPAWADTVPVVAASSWEAPPPAAPISGVQRAPGRGRGVLAGCGTLILIVAMVIAAIALLSPGTSSSHHAAAPSTSSTSAATVPTTRPGGPSAVPTTVNSELTGQPVYTQPLVVSSSDFEAFNSSGASGTYSGGGYNVTTDPSTSEIVYPSTLQKVTGQSSEPTIDVGVIGGSSSIDAYYGVVCRLTSDGNQGYFLEVSGGGLASIGDANSQFATLSTPSPFILQHGAPNLIRGICSGGAGSPVHLTLIVNGVTVLQTTRSSSVLSPTGTVGINVNNSGTGPATVHFNEFEVRVPAATPAGSPG